MKFLLTLSLVLCFVTGHAQSPYVNAGFGKNGEVIINNRSCATMAHVMGDTRRLMTTTADGKMLLGFRYNPDPSVSNEAGMGIIKVNADGVIDSSFGPSGIVVLTPGSFCSLRSLQVLADGKISCRRHRTTCCGPCTYLRISPLAGWKARQQRLWQIRRAATDRPY